MPPIPSGEPDDENLEHLTIEELEEKIKALDRDITSITQDLSGDPHEQRSDESGFL